MGVCGAHYRQAVCGDAHTLVVTETGDCVWACGDSARRRLGLSDALGTVASVRRAWTRSI